jgi:hypothetical protein
MLAVSSELIEVISQLAFYGWLAQGHGRWPCRQHGFGD